MMLSESGRPGLLAVRYGSHALLLLVCWAGLCALWLPHLRAPVAPPHAPQRQLLQSKLIASTRTPSATHVTPNPEDQLPAAVERDLPSLPFTYWHKHRNETNKFYKTKSCAPFPSLLDLEFSNTYWQTLRSSRGVFHMYSAYLDVRNASRVGSVVRLLVVYDRIEPTLRTHCQIWFEEQPGPVVVRVVYTYMWDKDWENYYDGVLQPYLLTCVLPADVRALRPAAVSLVEKPCDRATNCLRVHFDEPPDHVQKEIAVCVKGLDFQHEDLSVRLVEWIELVHLLGADKVFFYELHVHPNISKVLAYYRARGIVESTPITLPGGQPNLPGLQHMYLKKEFTRKQQMELVPYNDCLYRHMYQYRWLTLLDVDEVIVPMEDQDWSSLLKRVIPLADPTIWGRTCSSYLIQNVYYLDQLELAPGLERGAPSYMYMLQHVYRTRDFSELLCNFKAFHETGRVLALHNHFPRCCIGEERLAYPVDIKQARLHHYRANSVRALSDAGMRAEPVRDATLWRWADRLVPRVARALTELGLIPAATTPQRGRGIL